MPLPIALAVALLVQVTPAAGTPDIPTEAQLSNSPHWIRLPTPAELAYAYPAAARRRGLAGSAVISCTLDDNGLLRDCSVASESPPGQGFGAAALSLAPRFRMSALTPNGDSVAGGKIDLPLHFGKRRR
jgi:protein TonB